LRLTVLTAGAPNAIEPAFATARQQGIAAFLIGDDPMFDVESARLVAAAASHRIPTMYYVGDFVEAGGLFSYGPNFAEMAMQVGIYIGRILKGARPADLPVQQPTIRTRDQHHDRKDARHRCAAHLLARADRVVE